MAAAMVIPTMHEKSYIDLHNAHLKNISKFSHSHISQSQWRNREIGIDTDFMGYLNYTTQSLCKLILTQLTRIRSWDKTNFI